MAHYDPFIDGLPIKKWWIFPWLCQMTRWYQREHRFIYFVLASDSLSTENPSQPSRFHIFVATIGPNEIGQL